tara:strand:- start:348 stop:590 length:243 start_codon:yes stop_codon:yes gene_type:complete
MLKQYLFITVINNLYMNNKCECGSNMYEYTDGTHMIWLCYKCGRFEGASGGDEDFIDCITKDPLRILEMIEDDILIPVKL